MSKFNQHLISQRDGLLKEADHLNKRLAQIYEQVTELNTRTMLSFPIEKEHSPNCGCHYCT